MMMTVTRKREGGGVEPNLGKKMAEPNLGKKKTNLKDIGYIVGLSVSQG